MIFCGIKGRGTFRLKAYRSETMDGEKYHRLLHYHVLPQLKAVNGGTLNGYVWQQDGAPCHATNRNMQYLDRQFGSRVVSRKSINASTHNEVHRKSYMGEMHDSVTHVSICRAVGYG